MQRTISVMVGKGSVNHNSRKFKAENVDANRTHLNVSYCNKDIVFKINNKEYKYKLKDLGMKVDTDKTLDSIKKYQSKLSISKKNYRRKFLMFIIK